jgi:cyclic pyranopterin phosphate synthase
MPPGGIDPTTRTNILTFEEITRIVRLLVEMGVTKVRLTGGEPLVRRDIHRLVAGLAQIPGLKQLALSTNGVLLGPCAQLLRDSGLTRVNISLDSLRPERFEAIALRDGLREARCGIEAALLAGFESIKLNMVVMGGVNEDEVLDFVEFVRNLPIHLRFIEFMPFQSNGWDEASLVPFLTIKEEIESHYTLIPLAHPDAPSEIAKEYQIPGFPGTVGFISSMSDDFCGGCNRLRLLADGSVKSCLFHPAEENLREALRSGASDEEIEMLIRRCVDAKREKHEPAEELLALTNNPMIAIGG